MECPKCGSTSFAFVGFQSIKRITGLMDEKCWAEYFCTHCKTSTYAVYNFTHFENEEGEEIKMLKPVKKDK